MVAEVKPIAHKIVRPENCVLAFGIPTSYEGFSKALDGSYKGDFILNTVWEKYYFEIVSHLEIVEPVISKFGARVLHDVTLAGFGSIFSDDPPDVAILFSHWKDQSVEFADGLAHVSRIIEQVPLGFSGLLDLCVCHPENLAIRLRHSRPNCLVRFTNKIATPYLWLYFYMTVFKILHENNVTYLQALEMAIDAFIKKRELEGGCRDYRMCSKSF